jgi:hypothetical protein
MRGTKITDLNELFTVSDVKRRLSYDPRTGDFTWLPVPVRDGRDAARNRRFAGKVAGSTTKKGYVVINLGTWKKTILVMAHRLAVAFVEGDWPATDVEIDHKNGVRNDNRFKNLRKSSHSENGKSVGMKVTNKTGYKGVSVRKLVSGISYRAQILVDGKKMTIGHYGSARVAAIAYDEAATRLHGDFAKTNSAMGLLG